MILENRIRIPMKIGHAYCLCIRLLTGPCYEANEAPMALLS